MHFFRRVIFFTFHFSRFRVSTVSDLQ